MQYRHLFSGILFICLTICTAFYVNTDDREKETVILKTVLSYLDQGHYQLKSIDDDFSEFVFKNYLEYLDGSKRFLIQSELDQLAKYRKQLDDQSLANSLVFFDLSDQIMADALVRSAGYFDELAKYDFDYNLDETIDFDRDERTFSADEKALQDFWKRSIKHRILSKYSEKLEERKKDKTEETPKTDAELMAEAEKSVIKIYSDWFNRIGKSRRSDRFQYYINAITQYYGPHTSYFSPKRKSDFDIKMGGKLEGIGARLTSDGENTKITSIVVGGPAWKGKQLEKNDIILSVTQGGEPTLDITGMRLDDIIEKIRGKKGTVVTLKIKKVNGEILDIDITRDVINIEATFAKSLMLSIPDKAENIGYIQLPKFYSSFERKGGNSCAADVAKEIEKLKNQNAEGIILDLRNNLGGSLHDVIDMTGLFIESGPIVQVKSRDRDAQVFSDPDPEVRYDGPLVVLVNDNSASASEILVAAIQDYDRGVIVGSEATFGKGTVQRFYDLDRGVKGAESIKPFGQVKMTMQKYYRINGGSVQLKGVTSDIVLPDPYKYLDVGEREKENPLSWTQIEPAAENISQNVYVVRDKKLLRKRSELRLASSEQFQLMDENAKYFKDVQDKTTYPLNLDKFLAHLEMQKEESKKFDIIMEEPIANLEVNSLPEDLLSMQTDTVKVAKNEAWIEDVQKDIYLEEALFIMSDMKNEDLTYQDLKTKED